MFVPLGAEDVYQWIRGIYQVNQARSVAFLATNLPPELKIDLQKLQGIQKEMRDGILSIMQKRKVDLNGDEYTS